MLTFEIVSGYSGVSNRSSLKYQELENLMAVSTLSSTEIPGWVAGTWAIDPVHSDVSFTARHMVVSRVRGHFGSFSGTITTGDTLLDAQVEAAIDVASVSTNNEMRDNHLRTGDFFDAANHPHILFRSTGVRRDGEALLLDGELTLRGVTKPVVLDVDFGGITPDRDGGTRAGLTATTKINRQDFGVSWNAALEGGGVTLGDTIEIRLEIAATLVKPA
jgi:polyisoprenoid-binding protein YceI